MKKRKLEDLNLMDDFLFQEMVSKGGILPDSSQYDSGTAYTEN